MAPFIFLGGILIVRKIVRSDLVIAFFVAALAVILGFSLSSGFNIFNSAGRALFQSSLLFFAFVMITEPLTTPPNRLLRIIYGLLVGAMFAPNIHIGSLYSTPELALVVGNIFSYLVSPKQKLILKLKEKIRLTPDTYDFVFDSEKKFNFRPGQYTEWTLGLDKSDNRGNRRYFTLASSPTESEIRIGVKFYDKASSFKKEMLAMKNGDKIVSSQLAGDFVLPKDKNKKLAFIAGGIGITPFRSMIKYLIDRNESRDIILFYSARIIDDIVYDDIFENARELGIKTIYFVTEKNETPEDNRIKFGRLDKETIIGETPDFFKRTFYLSGPRSMVSGFEKTLKAAGVKQSRVKTDFFPGFA